MPDTPVVHDPKAGAVVDWQSEMANAAKDVAKLERPQSSSISLRSGVLSYQGTPVPDNKLQVVIIDYIGEHDYYEGEWDPNNVRSPVCFALHKMDEEAKPHELALKPQHDNCAECPQNKWASDPKGGRGKACQERRRFIVIPAHKEENLQPDAITSAEVATLKLPVTSVKFWGQYVNTIAGLYNRPPFGIITELGTQPNVKSQFNMTFKALGNVPDSAMPAIMQKRTLAQSVLWRPYDPQDENTAEKEAATAEDAKPKKFKK